MSLASVAIHPRVIVCRALELNAAAVILSHNHPSFPTEPSSADIAITVLLKTVLDMVAVRGIDRIIIAGNETVSLAEKGHLNDLVIIT
ncbi:JAB domain-containing protein [Pantoea sp. At-9b]|uniref:JAB domain-containing protein n=1 Tax=unclassified Pantoea TaxID=2630326 RepID=UPI001CBCEFCB|nr:JAB domain-containing protein [Pantoea sp. At-9b]